MKNFTNAQIENIEAYLLEEATAFNSREDKVEFVEVEINFEEAEAYLYYKEKADFNLYDEKWVENIELQLTKWTREILVNDEPSDWN